MFVIELLILAVLVGGLFLYAQISKKLDVTQDTDFDPSQVDVNQGLSTDHVTKDYQLIALVGLNPRDGDLDNNNSDTMIIACINNNTKEVKLVSVYRDTYLRVRQDEEGNGVYNKANNAYAVGGPEAMLTMMNSNMDLSITDYVSVEFDALAEVVDLLEGVDITLNHDEIVFMNDYCIDVAKATDKEYEALDPKAEGTYTLNGVQAVSYARIRYTAGNDFKRTQRQRLLIQKIVDKAKGASLSTLNEIMDKVFPMVKTSFSKTQIIKLASSLLGYNIGETSGFPSSLYMDDVGNLDCVIPVTLEANVQELHRFLFGEEGYPVTQDLKAYSDRIANNSGYGDEYIEKAKAAAQAAVPDANSEADGV